MIDINLIPLDLRSKKKRVMMGVPLNIPQDIFFGSIGGLLFLIVMAHVILGLMWFFAFGHLSLQRAQWQKVASDKKTLDEMIHPAGILNQKINAIAGMTTRKSVLWSQKLNIISDALPPGLWLTKITLEKGTLTIAGSVVSKAHDEIAHVGSFVVGLKSKADFMKDFDFLDVNSIQTGKKDSMDTADFVITAKLKSSMYGAQDVDNTKERAR